MMELDLMNVDVGYVCTIAQTILHTNNMYTYIDILTFDFWDLSYFPS